MTAEGVKTALVTGATSGIGEAFARRLAAGGWNLVLVARKVGKLEVLSKELAAAHAIDAEFIEADLTTKEGCNLVGDRIRSMARLDLLVNSAGTGVHGELAATDLGLHNDMVRLNDIALVSLCHAAVPGMITRGGGAIINVSSIAAFMSVPKSSTYNASKAFVNVFSQSLQAEVRRQGIKVQALCPGFTVTGFHYTEGYKGFDRNWVPRWMWLDADEVARKSLKALKRKRTIYVPGWKYRLMVALMRSPFAPLLRAAAAREV